MRQVRPSHPSIAHLERLFSLSGLSRKQLKALAARLEVKAATAGTCLLELDGDPPYHLYLLDGMVRLIAADGRESVIGHKDMSSRYALAQLRPSHYKVVALNDVLYFEIADDLLQQTREEVRQQPSLAGYDVEDDGVQTALSVENQLIYSIYQDLSHSALSLPTLSPLAQRMAKVVSEGDDDIHQLVDIVSADPVITSKLLRTVNKARSETLARIDSLPDAVAWLGRERTHALVLSLAKQEVFSSCHPFLDRVMAQHLSHSRQVAAISHVLAQQCTGFNPDTALLSGLLHDIGSLVIIAYADALPEPVVDVGVLRDAIAHLRGQIGEMILRFWDLPVVLAEVAHDAENWTRSHDGDPDYVDLVIVAQAHSFIATGQQDRMPPLEQIPAFGQMGFQASVEHSLSLLEQAKQEIRHIETLLGGDCEPC